MDDFMLDINILYVSLLTFIDSFLFLFLLKSFIHRNTHTKILHGLLVVGLSLLGIFLTVLNVVPYMKAIIVSFSLLIYTYFYHIKLETRLFIVFIFYFLEIFVESILTMFIFGILDLDINPSATAMQDVFFIGLLSKLMILGSIHLILQFVKPNDVLLSKKHHLFLIITLLLSIISMVFIFNLSIESDTNTWGDFILLFLGLTFVAMNIGVFYFYTSLKQSYKDAQRYEMKKTLDKMNEKLLSKSEAEDHKVSMVWHDIKNHMKTLEIMMEEKSHAGYESYIQPLKEQIEKIPRRIKTGNRIADIVLNEKHSEASAYKIDFHTKAAVPPKLEIEDADFSSILFNTIDNAIEAIINLPNKQEGFIHIDLYPRGQTLYYCIQNNYYEGNTPKQPFSKKKYLSSGYGLQIVQDIVSKYNGHLQYEKNDEEFILTIHLPVL